MGKIWKNYTASFEAKVSLERSKRRKQFLKYIVNKEI
jgi:hypothetical protein